MARNIGPSKNHIKHPHEIRQVCADCSANGAEWASINRGVLVCTDCCSVHRSLGRHVSQIKYIHDKDWHPHTWNLVSSLSSGGANGVWEHTLLDPTNSKNNKKKPLPSDPVHPVKADFVRAKHQMLSYVLHPPSPSPPHPATCLPPVLGEEEPRDGGASVGPDDEEEEALSQELHSSVRTANLETSLRLLAQGADPNYFHKGRGNCPLHVAASSGQAEQVELLLVYGATPLCQDSALVSPAQAARNGGYSEIAARLMDVELELVTRLLCYLSDQQTNCPPHSQPYRNAGTFGSDTTDAVRGRHFALPRQLTSAHQHATDAARQAREKLIKLPLLLLEELAADLYDEVDRRELDQVWSRKRESVGSTGDRCDVPFLPVNPLLSSTRNQARQKLARLQEGELCSLIVDLLVEVERRTAILTPGRHGATTVPARTAAPASGAGADGDDDEPVYDTVCEDDDYSLIDAQLVGLVQPAEGPRPDDQQQEIESLADEPLAASVAEQSSTGDATVSSSPAAVLVSCSLASSQQQVITSVSTHQGSQTSLASPVQKPTVSSQEYERLIKMMDQSQRTIQQLQSENHFMKSQLSQLTTKLQQLKQENDTLRVFGSPSPPATHSPSHASLYQSLPPISNGNNVFSCNSSESCSSGRCFSSLPNHQYEPTSPHHHHHSTNSQPRHIDTSSHHAIPAMSFPLPPSQYSTPPPSLPYSPSSSSHGPSSSPRTPFFNVLTSANNANKEWSRGRPFSMYDSRDQSRSANTHWRSSPHDAVENNNDWEAKTSLSSSAQQRGASSAHQRSASFSENSSRPNCDLPTQAEMSALSSSIAEGIHELLAVVQAGEADRQPEKYIACSEKICASVRDMASAFKKGRDGDNVPPVIHAALVSLVQTTVALNNLCSEGVYSHHIVDKAYAVAKATKGIVSYFQ